MKFTCIDLLPQSVDTILKNIKMKKSILAAMHFLLQELIDALDCFYLKRAYHLFDPHVGETCCQIRALMFLLLDQERNPNMNFYVDRISELKSIQVRFSNRLDELTQGETQHNNQLNLVVFLKRLDCLFVITDTERFLIQSKFLTRFKYRVGDWDTYLDYDKICAEMNVKKKWAKKISRYYQICLTRDSSLSVYRWAKEVHPVPTYADLIMEMQLYDDDNRAILPCYCLNEIILMKIRQQELPVMVIHERQSDVGHSISTMFFISDKCTGEFKLVTEKTELLFNRHCFVIKGVSIGKNREFDSHEQCIKRFVQTGLKNAIMANKAMHPQYSGKKLHQYRYNPFGRVDTSNNLSEGIRAQFMAMKKMAIDIGFCKENPSTFFIRHVYCDTPAHQLAQYPEIINETEMV